ncbi:DNA repair protein RadC [Acaricomes phytoseiuli]|uniref:JAB domain-containing protein n=1 Tax=Acaricomes phytoseiuli TaxID=291968 RepID=UPI00037771B6|nr:DNA repair protein RadC [Acaricomes phytoseiuli]MCW1248866.1 DNA repair protein RadC [Acaricomes phytoseiuli]
MASALQITRMTLSDQPRERLLALGASALSDAELVAILLGTGRAGESALQLGHSLLSEWHGVAGLSRADPDELARRPGVGAAKAARLVSSFVLGSRATAPPRGEKLNSPADIARIAAPLIGYSRNEQVVLLIADGQYQLKRAEVVSQGDATSCSVSVRRVLSLTLRHDGVAFAVAHNHPSGRLEPSSLDAAFTAQLQVAAYEVGLTFLDHVIVAGRDHFSITGR